MHRNNSKNSNDVRTRLVSDIIVLGGVGWDEFMSAAAWFGSGDSAAGGRGC